MSKHKDVNYWCFKCRKWFPVKDFIAKELVEFDKKAFCPRCGENHTSRSRDNIIRTKKTGSLSDPPSMAQFNYIRGLGRDPTKVKTKGDAAEVISKLKKEQGLV